MARQEKQRDKAAKRAQRATSTAVEGEERVTVDENGNVVSVFVPSSSNQSAG